MNRQEVFMNAAVQDLAWRLSMKNTETPYQQVKAAAANRSEDQPPAADLTSLTQLARQMVDTVLALAGQKRLSEKELYGILQQSALKYLETLPASAKIYSARLAVEVPRLINLPQLMRIAESGLVLPPLAARMDQDEIITSRLGALASVLDDLAQVAGTDFSVLLSGETGTGKEMLARRLHQLSLRRNGPFIAVHCGGLADNLIESELFGHAKGAFTGAFTAAPGYMRSAHGGTLFLDEIAETSRAFQIRLLRVLESKMVVPVGGVQGDLADFRLVTASHRDLAEMAAQGKFNQALLYRLMVIPIHLPPLRERKEDLPALLDFYLGQACLLGKRSRCLSPEARRVLLDYHWPGNVRQLIHVLQRMVALSKEYEIKIDDLPAEIMEQSDPEVSDWYSRRLAGLPGLTLPRQKQLLALLASHQAKYLTNQAVRAHLGCSDSTAKNLLKQLAEAGLVTTTGERGGRRYRVCPPKGEMS